MLNNYFTIKELAKYLNENISEYRIGEIYSQEKNKLIIGIFREDAADSNSLEFSIEKGFNYLVIKNHYSKAKKNFAELFEEVADKKILKIDLLNDDRVICFRLENEMELVFTFFSNKANCFLADGGIIINAFKDKENFRQKTLDGIIPKIVRAERVDIIDMNITIGKFIKLNYRKYGDLYQKEILFRNNLSDEAMLTKDILILIKTEFGQLDLQLQNPFYLMYSGDKIFYMSLIKEEHLKDLEMREFENINDLISEFIKFKFRIDKTDILRHNKLKDIEGMIAHINKKILGIQTQLKHSENSESVKTLGDIILRNIYKIKKGDMVFSYLNDDGDNITIKLKEELSPSENAGHYFDKYKKQKGSLEILKARIDSFIRERSNLESEYQRINNMTEYKTLLKEEKKSEEIKNDETSRFRKFSLKDKYEVWVGRDSASNDLLTTKYASQNDLWFHVRGASGSHTVLKVSNKKEAIDKDVISRAASIAAYYSKARNATNVPVAYCEKKYVKKKKGFKQGSVVMEREKVIFVKPALPE